MLKGTISYWRQQLTSGGVSPTELVQEIARSMEERNPGINACLSWDTEAALAAAAKADLSKPLGGIPIAIKDNIAMLGQPTRCASRMLENFISPYDATAVTKLTAAGAIPFGRTNMDEFAMGSYGQNSAFGETQCSHASYYLRRAFKIGNDQRCTLKPYNHKVQIHTLPFPDTAVPAHPIPTSRYRPSLIT